LGKERKCDLIKKVGFIGLGTMGRPFATTILTAGFDLLVYDVRPETMAELAKLGAETADSAREVARYAEVVDIAVRDEPDMDAVMDGPDGLLAGAHPGLIAAVHSSVHPIYLQELAKKARSHGVEVLDAQMSGGAVGVEAQTLCFMVGGDAALLEKCRPVLETTAGTIYLLGGVGMGAVTKIAQNTMTAQYLLAASEGFRIAEKAGVDLEVFQEVVRTSSAQSHVADSYLHGRGRSDIQWAYYHLLCMALDVGHTYDISLPGAATCMQALSHSLRKS
jgi:3-hydroxyisobutyrate dehydrogenase-like beta-hydroxyacid dehydrogenase